MPLLLLLIWNTNIFFSYCMFRHCSPHKVCICSSDVWHCFLMCGCEFMQHVPCKVFTLSGHPTQIVCAYVNQTIFSSSLFPSCYEVSKRVQGTHQLANTHWQHTEDLELPPSTSGLQAYTHASCPLSVPMHSHKPQGTGPKWSQHCGLPMIMHISTSIGDEESWPGSVAHMAETPH